MSASIVPFPVARRPHHIRAIARKMAAATPARCEFLLLKELRSLRDDLEEAGVPRPLVAAQLASLEANVRGELWRIVLRGEGGAA